MFFDLSATVDKAVDLIGEAARNGARLIAFPETWIPGYPAHIYGSAAWDDRESKEVHRQLMENSITIPSPELDRLCAAARRHRAMVVIGVNERDTTFSHGTVYNSMLFISDTGSLLGVHRKLVPTHAERIIWGAGDGSDLRVFPTDLGRIGGLVCWEHWMPLARFAMHAKGEQVHIACWPEVPDIHHLASRHYAFEGRCFVICVGSFMTMSHVPDDFSRREALRAAGDFGGDPDTILPGGSGIVGPDGQWVVGPVAGNEAIVYGQIDLDRVAEEQLALDAVGHYNRPDVFHLTVDDRARMPLKWRSEESSSLADVPNGSIGGQPLNP
ncbi:carbon-nitrogen hydrolase family protein [Mycolicibacterium goodii]|nr:carbon-nitrogen hydrolase family protein [Mycolicibacterium goodii]